MPGPRLLGRPSRSLLNAYGSLLNAYGSLLTFWAMIPTHGRILGVDWGEVRLGLALSDETQTLATPLETLTRRRGKRVPMPRLLELTTGHDAVGAVVGLPLTLEGDEGESAASARDLAETIARRTGLPVELWDERMSTARALRAVREQGGSTRGRKQDVDALAAAVLLQHFLDARRPIGAP
jgi:putative Holliday junction resolvase